MTTKYLVLGAMFAGAVAIGCGDGSGDGEPDARPGDQDAGHEPPATRDEVSDTYEAMANDCNGHVTRQLTANDSEIGVDNIWAPPPSDLAGLRAFASGDATTWTDLLVSAGVGLEGISDQIQADSEELAQRCDELRSLFNPVSTPGEGDTRGVQYTNVLVYLDDHDHVEAFPGNTDDLPRVQEVPARLSGYVVVTTAERSLTAGGVEYSDVRHQYLPIQIACDRELLVETSIATISAEERESLDVPEVLCEPLDGDASQLCVVERALHAADNQCTFVAIDAAYETTDSRSGRANFGGTLRSREATSDRASYTLTVDRFEF